MTTPWKTQYHLRSGSPCTVHCRTDRHLLHMHRHSLAVVWAWSPRRALGPSTTCHKTVSPVCVERKAARRARRCRARRRPAGYGGLGAVGRPDPPCASRARARGRGRVEALRVTVFFWAVLAPGGGGGGGGTKVVCGGNTARQVMDRLRTEVRGQQKQSNDPRDNQHNPQYANYWAPLTRKRHILPHPSQPQHTNHWAPRTRKRHQQEHRPQRPTESSDPTQHVKGRTGDCPGPRKERTTRRNVTEGVRGGDV